MASSAGSNLINAYILVNVGPNSSFVAPAGDGLPPTSYGTFGPGGNDSGGFAVEARAYKSLTFQLVQQGSVALAGYQVSLYGCTDPAAYQTHIYAIQGRTPQGLSALPFGGNAESLGSAAMGYYPGIPAGSWGLLPGAADAAGTGVISNPLTPQNPFFTTGIPLVAIRAVVTANAGSAGTFSVSVLATP